jgi:hypothetical protein
MGLVFVDGFDLYADYTQLSRRYARVNSAEIVAGRFGTGKCLSIQANNGFNLTRPITETDDICLGFAFRALGTGLSGTGTGRDFFRLRNGTNIVGLFGFDTGGRVKYALSSYNSALVTSDVDVITNGVWNFAELLVHRASGTSGSVEIKVNGVTVASETGVNTGTSGIDNIYLQSGNGTADSSNLIQYDDLYVRDDLTALGPSRVDTLRPSADTAQKDWTPSTGSDNYAMVDDDSYDDTTYVSAATVGDKDLYDFGALAFDPETIHAVQALYTASKDDVTARTVRSTIVSGATTANGATVAPGDTGFTVYTDIYETDPATSAAWDTAGVNALQAGIEVVS